MDEGQVQGLCFSPDGQILATGYGFHGRAGNGGVALWKVATRERLSESPLPVSEGHVTCVAFSVDGKQIAAGYNVGRVDVGGVVLWNLGSHQRQAEDPLMVKEGPVTGVAFSVDGKTFAAGYASGGRVGGVVLWDVVMRKRLSIDPFALSEGSVKSVSFSLDGKTIAAGYDVPDGRQSVSSVMLWDLDPHSWQSQAGRIANRNLTRSEWRQYFPDEPYRATFPDLPVPPEDPGTK